MRAFLAACVLLVPAHALGQTARAPYLQATTSDGVTIAWRTSSAADSVVCWGEDESTLVERAVGPSGVVDHAVRVDGLAPSTRRYYAISTSGECPPVSPGDSTRHFTTAPETGAAVPFRFWVLGDSGTGGTRQRLVYSSMLAAAGDVRPDLMLHMGDIAYDAGTTREFDTRYFAIYADLLANTPAWPTLGNHEGVNSDSGTQSGPYYEAYVLPTDGSAGGLPSGTEAYYAFDYANAHFVVLDSQDSSRLVAGPMLRWLEADLASTDAEWIVAFWHHPPYSDGTHDSDTEGQLIQMRQNALPILEAAGVDLVLAGHSHIYERSFLVHGAYDTPTTAAGHIVDPGDGRADGDGPYRTLGDGALYVVAGHGGAGVGGAGAHPLMYFTEVDHGSCLVDVAGPTMTLRNVRWDGEETDHVTLVRGDGIALLEPVGREVYLAGSTVDVTWVSSATSGEVRIEHSLDDGRSWQTITERTTDDGHHAWITPRRATTQGRVRVTDVAAASVSAQSPGPFTLSAEAVLSVIPFGSVWAYSDEGVDHGDAWRTELGGWPSGPAQLGYGDGDEATVLRDATPNIPTVYFRRAVTVDGEVVSARARVLYDDGIAVFVNGTEVLARNVENGLAFDRFASASSDDNARAEGGIDPALFVPGENVVAVIVKQVSATSSDVSFDLELTLGVRVPLDPDPPDAGPPDAGPTGLDSGAARADAGSDAGAAALVPAGCGCRAAGIAPSGSAHLWLAVLALLAIRRRRGSTAVIPMVMAGLALGCGGPIPAATASQRAQVHVTLYTTRWCPACAGARSWLLARGIPFRERDVESSPQAAAHLRAINPAGSVPTIDVEGRVLVGFAQEELRSAVDAAAHRY